MAHAVNSELPRFPRGWVNLSGESRVGFGQGTAKRLGAAGVRLYDEHGQGTAPSAPSHNCHRSGALRCPGRVRTRMDFGPVVHLPATGKTAQAEKVRGLLTHRTLTMFSGVDGTRRCIRRALRLCAAIRAGHRRVLINAVHC